MPPYDTDDEEEMEMECVEVLPDENAEDEDDEEEEEELAAAAPSAASPVEEEDDESTEEDDEDTDSEPEKESVASKTPSLPNIRIKLKMPPRPLPMSGAPASTPAPTSTATASKPPAATKATSSPQNDEVVVSVGGNKPKPNLPLKRFSPAGFLKKLPVANRGAGGDNDTSSVGGSSSAGKPKSRIRSLKLPLSKKVKDGDDGDASEALAEAVPSGATSTRTTPGGGTYSKRRSMHPSKPVKLPSLVSPGLKVTPPGGKTSNSTTAQLFDQAMSTAGYTEQSRTERPHRGSSIERTVGDLFDSDVKLTMHFPALVPPDLWGHESSTVKEEKDDDGDVVMGSTADDDNKYTADDFLEQLRQTMRPNQPKKLGTNFDEMLPVSLTVPLPESYIEDRLQYVKAVEERERAIMIKQEADLEVEFNGADLPPNLKVPPIPRPPEPPRLEQVNSATTATDKHPLYPPKQASLVAHLDPQMFHITEGRYFGLLSNNVADPNFCGPNALGATAGSTLATAGSSSTGTPLTLSSVLFSSHPPALATAAAVVSANSSQTANGNSAAAGNSAGPSAPTNTATTAVEPSSAGGKSSPVAAVPVASSVDTTTKDVLVAATVEDAKPSVTLSAAKEKKKGPQPTASSTALRKIMAEDGEAAKDMRQAIIRAAVYASRTAGHGQAFVAPQGEVFPDIGKAFAQYAGIKPCERCKSNKQGSYHCRLRRKHQEVDFDGGSSFTVLKDLLSQPIESLAPNVNVAADS